MKLQNRSIIITGASSGIGRATAIELSKGQNRLWLVGRNSENLKGVADIVRRNGSDARVDIVDLCNPDDIRSSFSRFKAWSPTCDLLLYCAGTAELSRVDELNISEAREMMETNFFGCLNWVELVLPMMKKQGQGILAGASAMASYRGLPQGCLYGASKAALSNFLESLRVDLRSTSIQVTTILPGFVDTPMARKFNYSMPMAMTADKAAKVVIKGLEAGRSEIAFPWRIGLIMKILKHMPIFLYDPLLGKAAKVAHSKGNKLRSNLEA